MNSYRQYAFDKLISDWHKNIVEHEAVIKVYETMIANEKDKAKNRPTEVNLKTEKERLVSSRLMLKILKDMYALESKKATK